MFVLDRPKQSNVVWLQCSLGRGQAHKKMVEHYGFCRADVHWFFSSQKLFSIFAQLPVDRQRNL